VIRKERTKFVGMDPTFVFRACVLGGVRRFGRDLKQYLNQYHLADTPSARMMFLAVLHRPKRP
jgi:hypothetical protein